MNIRLMELELGLALPKQTHMINVKGLDLNSCSNGIDMEIRNKNVCNRYIHRNDYDNDEVESKCLSLLLWSGQPNEEDDEKQRNLHVDHENIHDEENQEIVGWPPINSLRMELLHGHQGGGMANNRAAAAEEEEGRVVLPVRNSMYVKVKMEGVPIGRKIDLRLYNSYQALTDTLINMFAKYTKNYDSRDGEYAILYQDREGDWMLAGDVPWETFVESVQRMKILRNAN